MLLNAEEIKTEEVRTWRGLHLLHYSMSSCSQKVRILLRELALDWTSHPVNLVKGEQKSDWFRGVNPNGVVPVLVHDGDVHIESNDILEFLDRTFPSDQGSFFPALTAERIAADQLLRLEDERHADLRTITFSFVVPGGLMRDAPPISDEDIEAALRRFQRALIALDERLQASAYLCGERLMLPDIAWFIAVHRLVLGGYPIERHERVAAWFDRLRCRPSMSIEVSEGPLLPRVLGQLYRFARRISGQTIRARWTLLADHA